MMNRRHFLQKISASLIASPFLFPGLTFTKNQNKRKPNVIFILTDDQGWGDIHSHGNEILDTPVLDRLATESVRFDRFYVSAVCAPTRASALTGRYYLRTGVHGVTRGHETMRHDETTMANVLKSAGYVTGCFGKWHNGAHYPHNPNGQGFDEFFGFCAGHWNNYFDTTLEHNGEMVKTEGYITDVLTDAALNFIEENREQPFFCYIPYNAPHNPWQVPDSYFDKYKAKGLDNVTACVYGMVENLDDNIGRILRKLDELALTEDTIVIFVTDNGPNSPRFNGDMNGRKGSVHEGGVRVPCFIRWQGKIKSRTIPHIAAHIDLLPTVAELCQVPLPKSLEIDGKSLAPLIKDPESDWSERRLFSFRNDAGRDSPGAVRTPRWRAVYERGQWELYDMIADPGETVDVSAEHPQVMAELSEAYRKEVAEVTKNGFETIPIEIGHEGWEVVSLPGHEAFFHPDEYKGMRYLGTGIGYKGRAGWANDWISDWTDTNAYPWWDVKVVDAGEYEVSLMYNCAQENAGAEVQVEIGGTSVLGKIKKAFNPEPFPSPDRYPRGSVYEKEWATLSLGKVNLPKGETKLKVKALTMPGKYVMDLKEVRMRKC